MLDDVLISLPSFFSNRISVEYHDAFFNFIVVILWWAIRRLKIF